MTGHAKNRSAQRLSSGVPAAWQGAICVRRRLYRREMAILRDSITQQNQNGLFAPTKNSVLLGPAQSERRCGFDGALSMHHTIFQS
jgi:hypothetical protein